MEPPARYPHHRYGTNDADHNGFAYPYARHSELWNALTPHQPKSDWTDKDNTTTTLPQAPPHSHLPYPPESMIGPVSVPAHGHLHEHTTGAVQSFQENAYYPGDQPCVKSTWQTLPSAVHRGNDLHLDQTCDPHRDSRVLPSHAVPLTPRSTPDLSESDPRTSGVQDPWTTATGVQDTLKIEELELHPSGGFPFHGVREADYDNGLPAFRVLSSRTMEPPPPTTTTSAVNCDPDDLAQINKFMRRDVAGWATCVWTRGDGECGYSSHADLVKRHIKRVHFRLK